MSTHRLYVVDPGTVLDNTDFLWVDDREACAFRTNLTARLAEFPAGTRANRDFVRLAVAVFLIDRTRRRPKGWARDLELEVPMERPKPWKEIAPELQTLLSFLTGDAWTIRFRFAKRPEIGTPPKKICPVKDQYMLLSGGADSMTGALLLGEASRTCLVSHSAVGQHGVVDVLEELWGTKAAHFSRYVQRRRTTVAGKHFGDERTSRSRSLLFLALGLLAASGTKAPLVVPENGFASLNPPMAPERSGSLSTRTTHPWFLYELARILREVDAHADFANPFESMTKGEMFRAVGERFGITKASELLAVSYSCSRGEVKYHAPNGVRHCGVCFGCLVRRAAFAGSGLVDRTDYFLQVTDPPGSGGGWLTPKGRRDVVVAQYASKIGTVDPADIMATGLPPTTDVDAAISLAQRGLDEIKLLF